MQRKRIAYLDLIRIIACILVVMVHVSAQRIDKEPVDSINYFVTNAYNCLAFCGVSLFVMISGALALQPEREVNLKTLLCHKTLHFFLLYYIWKAFYQVISLLERGESLSFTNIKEDVILALIEQRGQYQLWFLPMIACLYMLVPLVKKSMAEKKNCQYFLSVFFVASILFPTLFCYEFKFKYLFMNLLNFLNSYDLSFFCGYLGYFVLGHYLYNFKEDITNRKRWVLYGLGIFGYVLACVLGSINSRMLGEPSYVFNTPFVVMNFFASSAIFVAIQSGEKRLESSERTKKMLEMGAGCTLGVYLVHPLLISALQVIGLDTMICNPILSIPLVIVCVVVLSGIVSAILLKIPVIRKLIQ